MKNRTWFKFSDRSKDASVAEIQIIDFIGDWMDDFFGMGVTAKQFVDELASLPDEVKTIRVRINSPGGDVFGAINIANALREQKSKGRKVETVVDGLAASAASIVLMAGDTIRVADNALVMIHNPWTGTYGNAAEFRKQADVLDQVRDVIVATYQWHAELSDKELVALMDAETWMDADEAIASGFAHEKIEGLRAVASIDPRHVAAAGLKVPAKYLDRLTSWTAPVETSQAPVEPQAVVVPPAPAVEAKTPPAPEAMDAQAVIALCAESGLDLELASGIISATLTEEDARKLVAAEKSRRDAEATRKDTINSLCKKFINGDLAPELIAGGMSADHARPLIAKVTAMLDKVELDAGLAPDAVAGGPKRKASINPGDIYRERNSARK